MARIADALHLDAVVDIRPRNCLDVAVESAADRHDQVNQNQGGSPAAIGNGSAA